MKWRKGDESEINGSHRIAVFADPRARSLKGVSEVTSRMLWQKVILPVRTWDHLR